jgi:hypothetical protein
MNPLTLPVLDITSVLGIECTERYRIMPDLRQYSNDIGLPAVTLPPGELMYIEIGFSGLSASRKRSCATINALIWSSTYMSEKAFYRYTVPFRHIIRSLSSREKISYVLSERPYR